MGDGTKKVWIVYGGYDYDEGTSTPRVFTRESSAREHLTKLFCGEEYALATSPHVEHFLMEDINDTPKPCPRYRRVLPSKRGWFDFIVFLECEVDDG